MENKVLTIAVPSYNAERYLLETIPTILNSKYIDREKYDSFIDSMVLQI